MAPFRAKSGSRLAGLATALALAGCAGYGAGGYDAYGAYGGYGTPYASGYYSEPYEPYGYGPSAGGYEEPFGLGVFGFGGGGWGGHDHDWNHHDWDHGHASNHWQRPGVFGERNGFAHAGPAVRGGSPRVASAIPHSAPPPGHHI